MMVNKFIFAGTIVHMPMIRKNQSKDEYADIVIEVEDDSLDSQIQITLNKSATEIINDECERGGVIGFTGCVASSVCTIDSNIQIEYQFVAETLSILKCK